METILLSFIAGALSAAGLAFLSSDEDSAALILFFGIPLLTVVFFFASFFLWRYEYVMLAALSGSATNISQEGGARTFGKKVYVLHDGQWVIPNGYTAAQLEQAGVPSGSSSGGVQTTTSSGTSTDYSNPSNW
jgi:hypothetical protein